MKKLILIVPVIGIAVAGCSSSTQASPADDKTAKENFSRALTADEMARMGGSAPAAPAKGK